MLPARVREADSPAEPADAVVPRAGRQPVDFAPRVPHVLLQHAVRPAALQCQAAGTDTLRRWRSLRDGATLPFLQYVVTLAVVEALQELAHQALPPPPPSVEQPPAGTLARALDVRIKWPNDIYADGLKVRPPPRILRHPKQS